MLGLAWPPFIGIARIPSLIWLLSFFGPLSLAGGGSKQKRLSSILLLQFRMWHALEMFALRAAKV